MSSYKLERNIPSCIVNRDLLQDIELYIARRVQEYVPQDTDLKKYYWITITDGQGEETLRSINDYVGTYFSNDTKAIAVNLSDWSLPLKIRIKFSQDKMSSELNVEFTGSNSKETVVGVFDAIQKIISNEQTINGLFHFGYVVRGCCFAIAFCAFTGLISTVTAYVILKKDLSLWVILGSLAFVGLFGFLTAPEKTFPYSAIWTKKYEKFIKFRDWFFWGILGAFIFSFIFVKLILGKIFS